jgi:hypothetical protein
VNLILGLILMLFVVFVPDGLVPTVRRVGEAGIRLIRARANRTMPATLPDERKSTEPS